MKKIIVKEGEFIATNIPAEISTILGSCVAVCLWDKEAKIGGMNHYLLPGDIRTAGDPNRGFSATKMLINAMISNGAQLENIEAKIFGGSNFMIQVNGISVGQKNADIAVEVLKMKGISIVAKDIGGMNGRKIVFNTITGKVKVKLLHKPGGNQINEEAN